MLKKVYFVRHGETNENASGIHQTHDVPLSDQGRRQVMQLAARFNGVPIDAILASHFTRTLQTAQIISQSIQKPLIENELLHEHLRPTEFHGKQYDGEELAHAKQQMDEHFCDPQWHYSDEENPADTLTRAEKAVAMIEARPEPHLIVVTHATFVRAMVYTMLFREALTLPFYQKMYYSFRAYNAGVSVLELRKDGLWYLDSWNDGAHLI